MKTFEKLVLGMLFVLSVFAISAIADNSGKVGNVDNGTCSICELENNGNGIASDNGPVGGSIDTVKKTKRCFAQRIQYCMKASHGRCLKTGWRTVVKCYYV